MTDEKWNFAALVMTEYFSALRGSWGDIDGRSEKRAWEAVRDSIDAGTYTLPHARYLLEVCPQGNGHWTEYCTGACLDSDG